MNQDQKPSNPQQSAPPATSEVDTSFQSCPLSALTPPRKPTVHVALIRSNKESVVVDKPTSVYREDRWSKVATADNEFQAWPQPLIKYNAALMGISGFSTSGYKMQQLAPQVASAASIPMFVRALPGHTGSTEHLAMIKTQEMIDSTVSFAQSLRERFEFKEIIGLGHSTGALAILCAHAQEQAKGNKLFDAIVLTGPPFQYFELKKRLQMHVGYLAVQIASLVPQKLFDAHDRVRRIPVDFPTKVQTDRDRRAPTMTKMPVNSFCCLEELRKQAIRSLKTVNVPVMYIHGRNDNVAHPQGSLEQFQKNVPPDAKVLFSMYEECGHSSMYDERPRHDQRGLGSRLLNDLKGFLASADLTPTKKDAPTLRQTSKKDAPTDA